MRSLFFLIFLFVFRLLSAVHFDAIFIGSSPISVLEALYRSYCGEHILILEAAERIGGAWKTIDICGVSHVDMGCHQIGKDPRLKEFLETYVGCHLVPMNNPYNAKDTLASADSGLYFSEGCYQLQAHLMRLIEKGQVQLLLDQRVQKVHIDTTQKIAIVYTKGAYFTANKLVITPNCYFEIDNVPGLIKTTLRSFHHLYLLLQDYTRSTFTYQNSPCEEIVRVINLTPFNSELQNKYQQLIALQIKQDSYKDKVPFFLSELKKKGWIDKQAKLIRAETYTYQQVAMNLFPIQKTHPELMAYFEVLRTDAIWNMALHVEKWKTVYVPFEKDYP